MEYRVRPAHALPPPFPACQSPDGAPAMQPLEEFAPATGRRSHPGSFRCVRAVESGSGLPGGIRRHSSRRFRLTRLSPGLQPFRDLFMADVLPRFQFRDAGLNLSEWPLFRLDVRGDGFGCQKPFGALRAFRQRTSRFLVSESMRMERVSVIGCMRRHTSSRMATGAFPHTR